MFGFFTDTWTGYYKQSRLLKLLKLLEIQFVVLELVVRFGEQDTCEKMEINKLNKVLECQYKGRSIRASRIPNFQMICRKNQELKSILIA